MTGDKELDELLLRVHEIFRTKGIDYGAEEDRLHQFRTSAAKSNVTMKQVLGIFMDKHLTSLEKWIKGEELRGEPIEEKLLDIICYSMLGYKIAKEEKRDK